MAPTPQNTLTREQQQALAKARARARVGAQTVNPMVAQGQAMQAAAAPMQAADSSIRPQDWKQPSSAVDPLAPRVGEEWRQVDRSAPEYSPFRTKEDAEALMKSTADARRATRENDEFRARRGPAMNAVSDAILGGFSKIEDGLIAGAEAGMNAVDPNRVGARFIDENVMPFAGLRENNEILRGIPQVAASIADNPVTGVSEFVEGAEPTHMVARGVNNLGDAGRAAMRGDMKEAQRNYSEAGPDILMGTFGMTAPGSMTVSKMSRAIERPGSGRPSVAPPAQPRPPGPRQQPNTGNVPPTIPPVLNATPVAPAVPRQQQLVARDTAKILTRLMRSADVKSADIRGYLPGAVQRYQGLNDSRIPFAFFLERDLPQHFPETVADEVVTKLQGWGRERNASTAPKDRSRSITQKTIKELRGSQQGFLTDSAEANLYKGSLIGQEDQILKSLRETGKKGYQPVLQNARDVMEGRRTPSAIEREGIEELRTVLSRPVFRDRIPNDVRMTAEAEGFDLMEIIERDPVTAAHWLQSNLNKLEDAAEINGRPTPASLAYGRMRTDVLDPLKKAAPGYEGALNRYGHDWGAKNAVSFGKGAFTAARSAYDTGQKVRAFKRLGRRQQTVAWKSIRDEFLNEFRGTAEDAAAKLTRMQQEGALDLLEQLGARGKKFADDIRRIAQQENPSLRAIEQASGSPTHGNQAGAKAARENVQHPLNATIGALTDKASWPMTIAGDAVVMGTTGIPIPMLTASKVLDRFGNPSAEVLSRATEGLYSLPPARQAGPPPPSPAPGRVRSGGGPRLPAPTQAESLDDLLKQFDAVEADPKTRGGPKGRQLLRKIEKAKAAAEEAPTPSGPINKAGFGGGRSSSLDMSEPSRMQRAREQGFDVDTPLYHGTAKGGFEDFDPYQHAEHGLFGQGVYLTDNPEIASTYTNKGVAKMERQGRAPRQTVYPVYARLKNPIDMDKPADIEAWRKGLGNYSDIDIEPGMTNEQVYKRLEEALEADELPKWEGAEIAQDILRAMGHDGVVHVGGGRVGADGVRHNVRVVFDPENIRGRFAEFDPSQSGSSKLLAGMGRTAGNQLAAPAAAATIASVGPEGESAEDKWPRMAAAAALAVGVRNLPALRQFASEARGTNQATFGGVNAKTADLKLQRIAEDMGRAGASRDQIWKETGWFKGNDGKWRFEIDDSKATLKKPEVKKLYSGSMKGILNDADAGGAYPQVAKNFTVVDPHPFGNRPSASYAPENGTIMAEVPPNSAMKGKSFQGKPYDQPELAREMLLHERQHAIQDAEDFARGGSPRDATAAYYEQQAAPIKARMAELEAQASGPNAPAQGSDDFKRMQSEFFRLQDDLDALDNLNEVDVYHRLAGEVEARNVQARRDFTPEERRRTPPWQTQDTPDERQIVQRRAVAASMDDTPAGPPPNSAPPRPGPGKSVTIATGKADNGKPYAVTANAALRAKEIVDGLIDRQTPAQAGFSFGGKGPPSERSGPPKANAKASAPARKVVKQGPRKITLSEDETAARAEVTKARRAEAAQRNKYVMRDNRDEYLAPFEKATQEAEARLAAVQTRERNARVAKVERRTIGRKAMKHPAVIAVAGGLGGSAAVIAASKLGPPRDYDAPPDPRRPEAFWEDIATKDKATVGEIQSALYEWGNWPVEKKTLPSGREIEERVPQTGTYGKVTKAAVKRWRYERGMDPDGPMTRTDLERLLAGPKGYQDDDGHWRYPRDGQTPKIP